MRSMKSIGQCITSLGRQRISDIRSVDSDSLNSVVTDCDDDARFLFAHFQRPSIVLR